MNGRKPTNRLQSLAQSKTCVKPQCKCERNVPTRASRPVVRWSSSRSLPDARPGISSPIPRTDKSTGVRR